MTEIRRTVKFSKNKERQWHRENIELYDKCFTTRWLRDPSAKATRNRFRQILDPSTEAPYIQTLLGQTFSRSDVEDPEDFDEEHLKPPRGVDFVRMNRHLQAQSQMSLQQKRRYALERIRNHHNHVVLAKERRAASAQGRKGEVPSMPQSNVVPGVEIHGPASSQVYQDLLDVLNRRRKEANQTGLGMAAFMGRPQSPSLSAAANSTQTKDSRPKSTENPRTSNEAMTRAATRQKIEEIVRVRREEATTNTTEGMTLSKRIQPANEPPGKKVATDHPLPSRVSLKVGSPKVALSPSPVPLKDAFDLGPRVSTQPVAVASYTTRSSQARQGGLPEYRAPLYRTSGN